MQPRTRMARALASAALIGRVATGSASLALPLLSNRPCVIILGMTPAATALPGLVLAGAWTDTGWPDTMEGAVRSGLAAARELRRVFGAARPETPVPSPAQWALRAGAGA